MGSQTSSTHRRNAVESVANYPGYSTIAVQPPSEAPLRNAMRQPMATGTGTPYGVVDSPLIVGVSTRALFDLAEEHDLFVRDGEYAYCALQRKREAVPLRPGCAFELIKRLLALNPLGEEKFVEVVLLSRNPPDLALRAFHSCEHHGLRIAGASFTSGRSVAPYAEAWGVDLFLSNDDNDVRAALAAGMAAARLCPIPQWTADASRDEVHFALDGDSVVFSSESDEIFRKFGLDVFERHEQNSAQSPMAPGPFGDALLQKLVWLRKRSMKLDGTSRVRITLVTARNAPAHERVIRTFRYWGASFDEVHFVGSHEKAPLLRATGAHIYFDDRDANVIEASRFVPAGLVHSNPT